MIVYRSLEVEYIIPLNLLPLSCSRSFSRGGFSGTVPLLYIQLCSSTSGSIAGRIDVPPALGPVVQPLEFRIIFPLQLSAPT